MPSLIFMDFETYWDKTYTLKKMTPIEYVLDSRFECLGVGVQQGRNGTPYWIPQPDIPELVSELSKIKDAVVVTHNALFDMLILGWRYNYVPPTMLDTLGMSRALLGYRLKSNSLASVADHLGFGTKWSTVTKTMGLHYRDIQYTELHKELAGYACDDASKCARIFYHLVKDFPASEVPVMDMVLRACVLPQFKLDKVVLEQHYIRVLGDKKRALELASVDDVGDLMSNEKFASLLRALDVDPPMKTSPATGNLTYAFAKTDGAFIDLAEHEDPRVQALVAARLGHKSTLEESRTQRLLSIVDLKWPTGSRWMPIPLGYGRAHTHRFGGDMKINMQNLPRKSALRRALAAPKGSTVISVDLSQIEARIVAWLCEQLDLLEAFAMGEDIYSKFAAHVFQTEVSRKINPELRFIGKTAILGLGYGMSWAKFLSSLKSGSKKETGTAIELSEGMGRTIISVYRSQYGKISEGWRILDSTAMLSLANGGKYMFGPCEFGKEEIILPNGLKLYYYNLQNKTEPGQGHAQWVFTYGGVRKFIYGAKLLENMTQALARIIITDMAIRVRNAHGIRFAHQVHDELIYVVKNAEVDRVVAGLKEQSVVRPTWAPELPIASEVKAGPNYGELVTIDSK